MPCIFRQTDYCLRFFPTDTPCVLIRVSVIEETECYVNLKKKVTALFCSSTDLGPVVRTEARVFLLYSTKKEASAILAAAAELGLTGKNYVWIATQAVIGSTLAAPDEFPLGMLGEFKELMPSLFGWFHVLVFRQLT